MNPKSPSVGTLIRLCAVVGGLAILAACGGGSSSSNTATPAVSLSTSTLTFSGQFVGSTSAAQVVTVTNTGTANLNFSSITVSGDFAQTNTCGTGLSAGSACSVSVTFNPTQAGTRNGILSIADNASGSPQTVSLTGTGTSVSLTPTSLTFSGTPVGSTSAPQAVKLQNTANVALAISSVAITTGSSYFSQTSNCGTGVGASGSCTIQVTYTPQSTGTFNGTLTVTDNTGGVAGTTQTVALTGTSSGSNSVSVTVGFGPNGYSNTADSYYNGIFTTVTVCEPGTATCIDVPNMLVDTGSSGLRVLSSALTGVTLSQVNDGSGDYLNECTAFGDGSFTWGPVDLATVQIGGESASQVPAGAGGSANTGIAIQVISSQNVPADVQSFGQCIPSSNTPDLDTVTALGANGILGIGTEPQDCSTAGTNFCTTTTGISQIEDPYFLCMTSGACAPSTVPYQYQLWNPVAAFSSSDTGGVALTLPSVPAGGQATVTGTLVFGIGTEANNMIPGDATVYEVDSEGNFASATLFGVTYTSLNSNGSFLDSGTNSLLLSDPATLTSGTGVTTDICADNGYYCPASTLSLNITLAGSNGTTSPTETLMIENADSLLNSTDAALNDLGSPSCVPVTGSPCATVTDSFDLGLPFFFNRTIFVGIAGTNTTYPNGYWAF
jgi:hypothetical protein